MRRILLLTAGLLLARLALPAQTLLLVDTRSGTGILDPASLRPLGLLGPDERVLCPSADGLGLWVCPAGHPRQVQLRPLSGAGQAPGSLELPGALLPQVRAVDAAQSRLWLAYETPNPQGGQDHGLALVDLAAATLAAFARVEGVPQALCWLSPSGDRPEQLLLAVALPESGQGALLALDPGLGRVLRSVDLPGKPESLGTLELADLPDLGQPPASGPTALTASTGASPLPVSPAAAEAKGFKSPFQALRGAFFGQVRDLSGTAVAGARLRAVNRRGQALETVSSDDGSYRLGPLSFGTYQVNAEKPGYRLRILSEQILLENAKQLDLVLEPVEP